MRQSMQFLALVASAVSASKIQGFNYGATTAAGIRDQAEFQSAFATAKTLVGTDNAFTSARLYTMIQGGTTGDVTSAIPAAIAEGTTLLLGLWASGTAWDQELAALSAAITTYGTDFTDLVTGISVGSEDLYRNSPTGIAAGSTIGQQPDTLVEYIKAVRTAIAGTSLSSAGIGHVDTWTAWVNGSNAEVIENCDWLGFDGYPYWQSTDGNVVTNGKSLFVESYEKVVAVAGSKDVWVTETGWAVTDDNGSEGEAIASTSAAKTYWDDVGCGYLFGNINTYWYTLSETGSTPNFGVSSSDTSTTPLFDLSCSNITSTASATASSSSTSSTAVSSGSSSGSYSNGTASSSNSTYSSTGSGSSSKSNATVSSASLTATASSTSSGSSSSSSGSSGTSSSSSSSSSSASSTSAAMANVASAGGILAAGLAALVFAL